MSPEPRNPIERVEQERTESPWVSVAETKAAKYREAGGRKEGTPNEDSFIDEPRLGLFAVLDGLSGHKGGHEASVAASSTILEHITNNANTIQVGDIEQVKAVLMDALQQADEAVKKLQIDQAGTTAALAAVVKTEVGIRAVVVSVGDSRVFVRKSDGSLQPVIFPQQYIIDYAEGRGIGAEERLRAEALLDTAESGDDLGSGTPRDNFAKMLWATRNVVDGALGQLDQHAHPQTTVVDIEPEDELLLVTDGISDALSIRQMEEALRGGESLIEAARAATGFRAKDDDATFVRAKARPKMRD